VPPEPRSPSPLADPENGNGAAPRNTLAPPPESSPSESAATQNDARGYSWPPAEPGNELALKHGAFSPRYIDPMARELVEHALALAGESGSGLAYLAEGKFRLALAAWARAQCIADRLLAACVQEGALEAGGTDSSALTQLHRWEGRAQSLRAELGLSPASWARLRNELAQSEHALAQVEAAQQRLRARHAQ